MKSLQQIWDKIGGLETQVAAQQARTETIITQNIRLLDTANATHWSISTVDSPGDVGQFSQLVFLPSGQPAVAYYDVTNGDLKFAKWNGSAWEFTTVDSAGDVGQFISMALDPAGQPAISYYDVTNADLKIARLLAGTWDIEVVDAADDVGQYSSLAFGPNGLPSIAYRRVLPEALKYARFDGTDWTPETVESAVSAGLHSSLAFGPNGHPHIVNGYALRSSKWDGSSWSSYYEGDNVGSYMSLTYSPDGLAEFAYAAGRLLKRGGPPTNGVDVEFAGLGDYCDYVFSQQGERAVSYYDSVNGNLRFSLLKTGAAAFERTIIDTIGDVGRYTSLAFGPYGEPTITYYDVTKGDLKMARFGVFATSP